MSKKKEKKAPLPLEERGIERVRWAITVRKETRGNWEFDIDAFTQRHGWVAVGSIRQGSPGLPWKATLGGEAVWEGARSLSWEDAANAAVEAVAERLGCEAKVWRAA